MLRWMSIGAEFLKLMLRFDDFSNIPLKRTQSFNKTIKIENTMITAQYTIL